MGTLTSLVPRPSGASGSKRGEEGTSAEGSGDETTLPHCNLQTWRHLSNMSYTGYPSLVSRPISAIPQLMSGSSWLWNGGDGSGNKTKGIQGLQQLLRVSVVIGIDHASARLIASCTGYNILPRYNNISYRICQT